MKASLKFNLETFTFKTFLRGFLVVGFFVLVLTGLVIQERPFKLRLGEGDIALKSIYAPYDFIYTGAPDEIKTQFQRQKASWYMPDCNHPKQRWLWMVINKLFGFWNNLYERMQKEMDATLAEWEGLQR